LPAHWHCRIQSIDFVVGRSQQAIKPVNLVFRPHQQTAEPIDAIGAFQKEAVDGLFAVAPGEASGGGKFGRKDPSAADQARSGLDVGPDSRRLGRCQIGRRK
jgi:hypothetical protein